MVTRPGEGRWSAGELVAHLIIIERAIISASDQMLQHPARHVPFIKRFHVPMAFVESRWSGGKHRFRKAASSSGPRKTCLAELRDVRERTLAFMMKQKRKI